MGAQCPLSRRGTAAGWLAGVGASPAHGSLKLTGRVGGIAVGKARLSRDIPWAGQVRELRTSLCDQSKHPSPQVLLVGPQPCPALIPPTTRLFQVPSGASGGKMTEAPCSPGHQQVSAHGAGGWRTPGRCCLQSPLLWEGGCQGTAPPPSCHLSLLRTQPVGPFLAELGGMGLGSSCGFLGQMGCGWSGRPHPHPSSRLGAPRGQLGPAPTPTCLQRLPGSAAWGGPGVGTSSRLVAG